MNVRKGFIVLSAILLTLCFTSCGGGGGSSGDGDDDYEWGGMAPGYYVAEALEGPLKTAPLSCKKKWQGGHLEGAFRGSAGPNRRKTSSAMDGASFV